MLSQHRHRCNCSQVSSPSRRFCPAFLGFTVRTLTRRRVASLAVCAELFGVEILAAASQPGKWNRWR